MAHEVETMAYAYDSKSKDSAYQHPWHKFDTGLKSVPVNADMSPADMLKKAGLDWTLERASSFIEVDGEQIPTGKDVLYRSTDNKIMTHVSEGWHEVQNSVFADFFSEFCAEGSMEMNTMGSLREGKRVFALARVKDAEFSLFRGKDVVEPYFLFSNPHEYGQCLDLRFVCTRVVCMNTFVSAMNENSKLGVRLNHRSAFEPDLVKEMLEISKSHMSSYKEAAEFLSKKKFSVENLKEYYQTVFPSSAKDEEKLSRPGKLANAALETQPGAEFGEGTWWSAYNSVTYTVDHLIGRTSDNRMNNAWFGGGRKKKIEALDLALEYADA